MGTSNVLMIVFLCLLSPAAMVPMKTQHINAIKGKFMTHMLHSAYFFPHTVDVKWSATTQNKPDLPFWLHLYPSKHKAIAYLIGTPVTPAHQVTIHVIARRTDTFAMGEQFLTIALQEDDKYNTSTQQTVEFILLNHDPESLLSDRTGKMGRLENVVRETFRGKSVNPYIFNLVPEIQTENQNNLQNYFKNHKFGTIVKIGTQKKFHPNVQKLMEELRGKTNFCNKSSLIPLNKRFHPEFIINWCTFKMSNVTMLKSLVSMESNFSAKQHSFKNLKSSKKQSDYKLFIANETSTMAIYQYDFWESFLIFPMLAVLCIILILILSFIFFGRREGQHWRDYKTPREQLQEYLILRESQKRLRELSVQRQILLMSNERKTSTPVGIRTFLQPNSLDEEVPSPEITVYGSSKDYANHSPFTNTAKQTVADAVKATGSSLRLYKNPTADSEDENDEEKVAHKKHHRKSNS